ncbi:VWA domain-containing protein [Flagellimonas crocea]|uniref:VWA domain-containing protein n=1 Tax=Flagellimonas crocea TaxID=3067311 RepID=UPI00296F7047|nr:VWA domain-containing protein [Muricauda sp. DH64]
MKKESHLPILKLIPFLSLFLILGCSTTESPIDENVLDGDEETVTDNPNDSDNSGNDNDSDGNPVLADFYRFTTYQNSTADPFDVNILFHVSDNAFRGVPNLKIEDLIITENDEKSPIDESKAALFDRNSFELVMRTALLIDVSNSIQTDFATLKEELKALIDGALPFQEIAIYTFSSTTELVQDYSTDKEQLKGTIDNLQLGTSSTDFYGAVVTAANSFTNGFVENEVTVGNLIIFTDGDDTQARNTFTAAKEALIDKNAYVVGLSSADLDEDNIKNLFGDSFYFPSESIGGVNESFGLIQTEIENYANSVYLLNYETPKRGDNNHYLKIYHKENSNDGADHYAVGEFVSTGFYEPVAPTAATLISPIISEEITLTNMCSVTFEVGKSIDENLTANDEITYEFYFGDSETTLELIDSRTVPVTQETITFESPSGLITNSNYSWQIKTKDDDFEELDVESEVQSFNYQGAVFEGDISISSQEQLDSFCYTSITGNLNIANQNYGIPNVEFVDYQNLEIVKNVEGYVWIRNETKANLDYLNNLETIGGFLRINQFNGTEIISGFKGLQDLGGGLSIFDIQGQNTIREINGFNSLEGSFNTLSLSGLSNLESIVGFNNLQSLNLFYVGGNPKLSSINGFENLKTVNEINITENDKLESISGYSKLENIVEFNLDRNPILKLLNGFNSLNSIWSLNIFQCGLESFTTEATTISNIQITGCPNLVSIDFKNVVNKISGLKLINLKDLNSLEDTFDSNLNIENLTLEILPGLRDLKGFEELEGIEVLSLNNNINLESLNGLSQNNPLGTLSYIAIEENTSLIDLCGLSTLDEYTVQTYRVLNNAYNPILTDLINGNCKQ